MFSFRSSDPLDKKCSFTFCLLAGFLLTILLPTNTLAAGASLVSPPAGSNLSSSQVTFTWTAGTGRYVLYVGTSQGNTNIHNSGFLDPSTLSRTVSGVPTTSAVYVRLWCERPDGNYDATDYVFNRDLDQDGIYNELDLNPETPDAFTVLEGNDFVVKVNGSGRVASLESADLFNATTANMTTSDTRGITSRIYEFLKDDFDFIFIASNQTSASGSYAGRFYNAQNSIQGIGKSMFDNTAAFGSAGKLQGAIHLSTIGALTGGPSLHELIHNWGNTMSSVPSSVGGHWGYSNIGGQLGGWQPNSLESLGGGQYRARSPRTGQFGSWGSFANGGNGLEFSRFELYTMGLIGPDEVGHDIKIANDFAWVDSSAGIFSASSITTTTMSQVVAIDGLRSPGPATSQKNFRILYLILTPSPLSNSEWAAFDEDVYDFALPEDDGSSIYNFWEATGGLATVTMDGLKSSVIDPQIKISEFGFLPGSPNTARITFESEVGVNYTLQTSGDLTSGSWVDRQTQAGTGGAISFDYETGAADKYFFRFALR